MTILNSKSASASWYQGSWTYREKLTVNHTKVSGTSDLANFPILITITDVNVKNNALSNGNDILFTSSDGTTKLNHEIEKYDSSTGSLQAWVSVPKLSPNKDTDIYIYYGNSGASDQSNKTGVWSGSGYQNVWHLSEDPSGSAPQVKDSTSDANNGTSAGSMASNQQVAGQVDGSLNFDGANDEIDLDGTKGEILATSPITLEAWFYADSDHSHNSYPEQNQYARLIARKSDYGSTNTYTLSPNLDSNNVSIGFWDQTLTSTGTYTLDAWHHVVGTYDGSGNWSIYLDGNLNNSQSSVTPTTGSRTNVNFRLGAETTGISLLDGKLDEVRVSTSAKSAGWVKTEFNNQSSPSTFLTSSSLETQGPVLYLAFNEGQGLTANDSSGQTNTGTLAGSTKPTWQTEDLCVTGKCLYFEGSSASVTVANTISLVKTVSFWVKPKTNGEYLMDLDDGTHYISASAGTITATGFSSPTYYVNGIQTRTLTANTWNYIEITTATGISASAIKVGDAYFSSTHHYLNGFVDDVKMYDYVRSASQVKTDFASRGSVKGVSAQMGGTDQAYLSKGLVGYWKMDESSGNATDSSGNSLTLTNNSVMVYGAGKFGNAVTGDGTADYLNTATAINGIKTVSFWAYTPDTTNYFVNLINSSAYITSTTGTITATGFTTPSIYVNGTLNGTISANTWTHVVITTDTAINANAFAVGLTNDGSNHFYTNTSKIDEVRTYNRALSPKEISDLYNWAPGPVGYWNMDDKVAGDNKTIVDTSGNGNNGTTVDGANNTGMSCNQIGKYGGACQFDGTDDYVDITNSASGTFNFSEDGTYTLSAWVYLSSNEDTFGRAIICKGEDQYCLRVMPTSHLWQFFEKQANGNWEVVVGPVASLNQWTHVVGIRNGTSMYLYVNGNLVDNTPAVDSTYGSRNTTSNLQIGMDPQNNPGRQWHGQIDDVKIYNYARTQKQIVSDMNANHPAVGSPVGSSVAYWEFDEGALNTCTAGGSTDFCDNSINANHLAFSTTTGGYTNSGKFGKAFNGTGTVWASKADDADFDVSDTDDYTVSLWFKSDAAANPGATEYLFNKANATTAGYAVYANTDGTVCFGIDDDTTWGPDISSCSPTSLYDAVWHHLIAVRDHTGTDKTVLYVDGILKDSDSDTTTATLANSLSLYIGDRDGVDNGDEFNGDLDEVKVYRYALNTSDVKTEFNRGQSIQMGALGNNSTYQVSAANQEYCVPGDTTACLAPVLRYNFEEGTGTIVNNTSGNGITGTWTKTGGGQTASNWSIGKFGKAGNWVQGSTSSNYDEVRANAAATINNLSGTDLATDFSGEAWIYLTAGASNWSTYKTIMGKLPGGAGSWQVYTNTTNRNLTFSMRTTVTAYNTSTANNALSLNAWNHIAFTWNGSTKTPKLYINGNNVTPASPTPATGTTDDSGGIFRVGNAQGDNHGFNGQIDEVKLFNYARTPAQIAWDYNRGAPVAQWKFDECSGLVAHDSISTNNGTITIGTGAGTGHQDSAGTCTVNAATVWYNGVAGKRNYSLNFDGIDDYVTVPDTAALRPGISDFSTAFWFKAANANQSGALLAKRLGSGTFNQWQISTGTIDATGHFTTSKKLSFILINNGTSDWLTYVTTNDVIDGNWHHVVATRIGSTDAITMYIDGKNAPLTLVVNNGATPHNINNTQPWTIAWDSGTSYFSGQMDDVKIFNYALTATQIKNLYNGGAVNYAPATGSP